MLFACCALLRQTLEGLDQRALLGQRSERESVRSPTRAAFAVPLDRVLHVTSLVSVTKW